ncbi:MAG: DUF3179 domain-containing protein [Chloroflexi bacterium]|nr:DUF3179 domain-containing protein [Chloroflexota bacterium]
MAGLLLSAALGVMLLLAACGPRRAPPDNLSPSPPSVEVPSSPSASVGPSPEPTAPPPAPSPEPETGHPGPSATPAPAESPSDAPAHINTRGWKTDFSRHSVPYEEIMDGIPWRDAIPPIDHPKFVSVREAEPWLEDREPIIAFVLKGEARAYPIQLLIWHEVVNDVVAGEPVVITFCPLCNTAFAFSRVLDGTTYDFGVSGKLRYSDLVMWDRQTESWWQQATGEGIVGELTGRRLKFLPASMVSWANFKSVYPRGQVLSRDTGFSRDYGFNPYPGYDDVNQPPFLFFGPHDGRLSPMERVVSVLLEGEAVAYPFSVLEQRRVVTDVVGGKRIVVFYSRGTASPLDREEVPAGRPIGAAAIFEAVAAGGALSFTWDGESFQDQQTGTTWDLTGRATSGPLQGQQLTPVVHGNPFWFAWAAFEPDTRIWAPF